MKQKIYDYDGYKIYTVEIDKFKNCYIEVNFREDARLVNITKRNMIHHLLSYTSLQYPTKREMRIRTEELYNLEFSSGVSRSGYNLFTSFSIDMLNPKFILEADYLENCIAFLFDSITNPHIENEEFNARSFSIIKERMRATLEQYKENPLSYAVVESKKELFADSLSGTSILGNVLELEEIDSHDLVLEYQEMMKNAHCDILVIGSFSMDEVVSYIKKYFHKPSIISTSIPFSVFNKINPLREVFIPSVYNQTHVLLLYQLEEITDFEKNFVGPLFQRILGNAGMRDKLTYYLREKNSLCYSCGCSFSFSDSLCIIYTGLSSENIDVSLKYIRLAMQEMLHGHITKEELESQKEKFLSDIKLREDSIFGIIDNYYFHNIAHYASFSEYSLNLPQVTVKDLQNFALKMHEALVYVQKEVEKDEENLS